MTGCSRSKTSGELVEVEDAEHVDIGDGDVVFQAACLFDALLLSVERGVLTRKTRVDLSVDSQRHWGGFEATAALHVVWMIELRICSSCPDAGHIRTSRSIRSGTQPIEMVAKNDFAAFSE